MNELVLTDNSSGPAATGLGPDAARRSEYPDAPRVVAWGPAGQDPNVQITISRFMREFISHLETAPPAPPGNSAACGSSSRRGVVKRS